MDQPAQNPDTLRMMVYASLMAALTGAGAVIAIPLGPVPVVLQNVFIMMAGLLLGARWGLASVGIYLLAGALGLPVFAGGSGGIGRFLGPTGGYLLGFVPAVLIIGLISGNHRHHWLRDVLAVVCGCLVVYVPGVTWLKLITRMQWSTALTVGMLPFLAGDALKAAAAVAAARVLRPRLARPI